MQARARQLVLLLSYVVAASGKACQGEDLPADSQMRTGKKYTPETCTKVAKRGDKVRIGYEASLYSSCEQVDQSYHEGWEFELGDGTQISGLDRGVTGMCERAGLL